MGGLLKSFQFSIGVKTDTKEVDVFEKKIDALTKQIQELHEQQEKASKQEQEDIKEQIKKLEKKKAALQSTAKIAQNTSRLTARSLSNISKFALGGLSIGGALSGFLLGHNYNNFKDLNKDLMSVGVTGGKVFDLLNASQASAVTDLSAVSSEIQDLIRAQREYKTFGFTDKTQLGMFGASIGEDISTIISKFQHKIRGMNNTMGREFAEKMGLSQMYEILKLSDEEINNMRGADLFNMGNFSKMQQTVQEMAKLKNTASSIAGNISLSFSPIIITILKNINNFLNGRLVRASVTGIQKILDGIGGIARFLDPNGFKVLFLSIFGAGISRVFSKVLGDVGLKGFLASIRTIGLRPFFDTVKGALSKIVLGSAKSFVIGAVIEDLFHWFTGSGVKTAFGEIFGEIQWGNKIAATVAGISSALLAYIAYQKAGKIFEKIPLVGGVLGHVAGVVAPMVMGAAAVGGVKVANALTREESKQGGGMNMEFVDPEKAVNSIANSSMTIENNRINNNNSKNNANNSVTVNFYGGDARQNARELDRVLDKHDFKNQRKNYQSSQFV